MFPFSIFLFQSFFQSFFLNLSVFLNFFFSVFLCLSFLLLITEKFYTMQFLTKPSLRGHPLLCIPIGRQRDRHFISWMRDNVRVKRSFACGHIDICFQIVLHRKKKSQKRREMMQIFVTKFPFPCKKKTKSWKYPNNLHF